MVAFGCQITGLVNYWEQLRSKISGGFKWFLLQPKVAHYYINLEIRAGRPSDRPSVTLRDTLSRSLKILVGTTGQVH